MGENGKLQVTFGKLMAVTLISLSGGIMSKRLI